MTDYKKLCASLREEAEAVKAIEWDIPICTQTHILESAEAIERLVRERDAVIKEIQKNCYNCKYRDMPCNLCHYHDKWEWKGAQE